MRRLHGAFTAQLLLVCAVSAVIVAVPSPTNVTLSCQNLKTTVRWEYSEQQPQTSFEVLIISSEGRQKNETTDHQYDLSPFIWGSERRYEGYYSVNVTAVQGGNKSTPAESQSLSFNEVKPAHVKCELDFPPVSLTEDGSGATVSFYNPVHFYKELQTATKQNNVVFRFTVNITGKLGTADCRLENTICRYDFSFPEGVNKCVSLDGELFDRNFINSVKFRQTSPVCVTESAEVHMVTLTILLCVFIIIIILAAIAIYKVRAYLNEKSIHPTFLKFIPSDKRYIFKTNEENISPLVVEDNSYSSEEEGGTPEDHRGGGGCGGGGRSNGSDQLTAGYGGGDLLEDSSQEPDTADEDSADDSVKTECVMIEEEEEEWEVRVGAYDCAHNIPDTGDEHVNMVYTQR